MFVGVKLARAGHPALHLVEHQHEVMLVGKRPQAAHELLRCGANAALALYRLDQEAGGMLVHRRLGRLEIVELDHRETGQKRREAVAELFLVGRADRRHRPPVEGVRKSDQLVLVGIALGVMIAPRGLDRAFDRLGARIGEEHRVGEGQVDQPLRQRLALRAAVEVRDMHQPRGLILDRLGQVRVAVTQQIDRDAAGEIEIFLAAFAVEIDPLAFDRPHRAPRVNGHERRDGHGAESFFGSGMQKGDHARAGSAGGTRAQGCRLPGAIVSPCKKKRRPEPESGAPFLTPYWGD